jgi:hypothetical protein
MNLLNGKRLRRPVNCLDHAKFYFYGTGRLALRVAPGRGAIKKNRARQILWIRED